MKEQRYPVGLLAASGVLFLLFVGLAVAVCLHSSAMRRDSLLISTDAVPGSVAADALRRNLSESMHYALLAATAADPVLRDRHLDAAREAEAGFQRTYERYLTTIHINPDHDRTILERLRVLHDDYIRKFNAYVSRGAPDGAGAGALQFVADVTPVYLSASEAANALVAYNDANAIGFANAIEAKTRQLLYIVLVVAVLAVLSGGVLAFNIVLYRREQRQLREHEHLLRQILDNLSCHIWLCDPQGKLVEINASALGLTHETREAALGTPLPDTPGWSKPAEVRAQLGAVLREAAASQSRRFELKRTRDNLSPLILDFRCDPIRDAADQVPHVILSATDISDRRLMEQQMLRTQRLEAIGTLTGGLVHDLNNILTPMLLAADLLRTKLDSPRDRAMLAMIESGAQRGADIVRQLLTFGRGTLDEPVSVNLRHILKELGHIVQETFPRTIIYSVQAPPDLWPLKGDPTQLHQLLLNLCLNARDAMPRGGKLQIALGNVTLGRGDAVLPADFAPGPFVRIMVSDTGEGMPAHIQARIFDPFFTTKPPGKGTGLGLSSALGIIKGHGGFVHVESEPDRGATFVIHLPADTQASAAPSDAVRAAAPRGTHETILLVDDEPNMLMIARVILEQHDYRVVTAANGAEAVQCYVQHRDAIRLVITDADMPLMNGADLIRALRVLKPDIRTIVMTGSSSGADFDALMKLDLPEILPKPCDAPRLLRLVREVLGAGRRAEV